MPANLAFRKPLKQPVKRPFSLQLYAGRNVLPALLRSELSPGQFRRVVGASGGPKWFVLQGLDEYLSSDFFRDADQPIDLIGSSAGSWRFSCYKLPEPAHAIRKFGELYAHLEFPKGSTPSQISAASREVLTQLHGQPAVKSMKSLDRESGSNIFRLNVVVSACKGLLAADTRPLLGVGLSVAALANRLHPRMLSRFFTRQIYREFLPAASVHSLNLDGLLQPGNIRPDQRTSTEVIELTEENFHSALMASGSIPWVMEGEGAISGSSFARHRDGGLIDYQFDWDFGEDGWTLYPHYAPQLIPGWFDKSNGRRATAENHRNTLLICPSADFVQELGGKIPDRSDFQTMKRKQRLEFWNHSRELSYRLADDLQLLIENPESLAGDLRCCLHPIETIATCF